MARTPSTIPIVLFALLAFFIFYLIMIPPVERARILQTEEVSATNVVYIEDGMFIPEEITISKGDFVLWINNDMTKHRIVGADFKSPVLLPNARYMHQFDESGVFVYSSEFYPGMVGKVIVE